MNQVTWHKCSETPQPEVETEYLVVLNDCGREYVTIMFLTENGVWKTEGFSYGSYYGEYCSWEQFNVIYWTELPNSPEKM